MNRKQKLIVCAVVIGFFLVVTCNTLDETYMVRIYKIITFGSIFFFYKKNVKNFSIKNEKMKKKKNLCQHIFCTGNILMLSKYMILKRKKVI